MYRLKHLLRKTWHKLIMWAFGNHFQDELVQIIHPDFGSLWQPPDGEGYEYLEQSFNHGYTQAQLDFYRDGVKGWERA